MPAIIALIVLVGSLFFVNYEFSLAKASTNVESTISSDTIWSKTNSPYNLIEQTLVETSVKLTIEPGVVVNLNGNSLLVNGSLVAQGSDNEKIFFNTGSIYLSSEQNGFDSIIENAVLNDIDGFTISSGSPLIANNSIDARIVVKGGSPIISNNKISDGVHADAKGGPVTITKNEIASKSGFSAIYVQGIHADIVGNKIFGNNSIGINGFLRISSFSIEDNQISNCSVGIRADLGAKADDMRIIRNLIFNNNVGIHFWGMADIRNNTIAQNSVGIQCGPSNLPFQVTGNNLQNNSQYNIEHMHLRDLDARNNWWGTTDLQLINQSIFDRKNDSILGEVKYMPFLVTPNSNAPGVPENPAVIPTTTNNPNNHDMDFFPVESVAAIVIVVVIVAASLLVYYEKHKHNLVKEV